MLDNEAGFECGDVDGVASAGVGDAAWTFGVVEDRLVEAMRFAWRDEPGTFPFAKDGPWALMTPEAGDYDKRGGDMDAPPLPRVPLSRDERARMDAAVEWLSLLSDPVVHPVRARRSVGGGCDARLVVLATRKLAAQRGERRDVRWSQLLVPMGMKRGAGELSRRYSRAIASITAALHHRRVDVVLARG